MTKHKASMIIAIILSSAVAAPAAQRDYAFDGKISRQVLENYLSRSFSERNLQ